MVNIKQIAQTAGVSITTVSRVLNDHPYVSQEKRERVLHAVEQLNYAKNINAIHLIKGKTFTVGVMLPFINLPYFSTIIEGIGNEALIAGYHINLCQTNYDSIEEIRVLEMMKMKQFDGMIICSRTSSWEQIEPYSKFAPIVSCEKLTHPLISSVYVDHYEGFRIGTNYLLNKGHTRIGVCLARRKSISTLQREKAFADVLQTAQRRVQPDWMFYQCYTMQDGAKVLQRMLNMKERPTAIFAANDQVAAGLVTEAKKQGLHIPEDLAVLGFDNHEVSKALEITTIEHPGLTMGARAFSLFHKQMQAEQITGYAEELPFHLIERKTV
ncbi:MULTISPECIES: LacI family DNA-binding transcriptional regulator [Bacillus cereus group]|uniref:Periplasmic binding protein/LacI transcriptional regulator n=1 Tax=Bacillus cytotoxicus (strain DSM 22905 / CIP 110041 / 391-98 / NVH 391-98) TaxID=315749 RepID=A7GSM6_BACCN|nr:MULTISPECIES: LacI family DNA-binding transcriptional regulator [Bacillus cereus group]ABS23134.1 periplasmic binding protein/LacI transcriptional regulator [Bacillus cytotoxicus NVH 391-98]AWC29785.1 LacI family transcriptional regulator [Bacillus cytotoxicus]AWC33790.1 LacI family transcriptional regulator [Bacillus cytotoxicus]AWC37770.1 LacI family transcriptional regulator [Bacillus cytotoxicus]AWC41916.1 LacI family transcriptional regulator [Bacillus cytotoxicus]